MSRIIYCAGLAAALALGGCGDRDDADNTHRNKDYKAQRTAGEQSNATRDVDRTAEIRRAVVDDDKLSTDAKNIKIVTVDGSVTLTGPVASSIEKALVLRKAIAIAGAENVRDDLTITGEETLTPSALPSRP